MLWHCYYYFAESCIRTVLFASCSAGTVKAIIQG